MIYMGMIFFVLAIVSGLCGFADVITPPVAFAELSFYVCVSLASLSFALCLRTLRVRSADTMTVSPEKSA
jgi:uncharacterized membrane protein YtjA (UPF0391 family)